MNALYWVPFWFSSRQCTRYYTAHPRRTCPNMLIPGAAELYHLYTKILQFRGGLSGLKRDALKYFQPWTVTFCNFLLLWQHITDPLGLLHIYIDQIRLADDLSGEGAQAQNVFCMWEGQKSEVLPLDSDSGQMLALLCKNQHAVPVTPSPGEIFCEVLTTLTPTTNGCIGGLCMAACILEPLLLWFGSVRFRFYSHLWRTRCAQYASLLVTDRATRRSTSRWVL